MIGEIFRHSWSTMWICLQLRIEWHFKIGPTTNLYSHLKYNFIIDYEHNLYSAPGASKNLSFDCASSKSRDCIVFELEPLTLLLLFLFVCDFVPSMTDWGLGWSTQKQHYNWQIDILDIGGVCPNWSKPKWITFAITFFLPCFKFSPQVKLNESICLKRNWFIKKCLSSFYWFKAILNCMQVLQVQKMYNFEIVRQAIFTLTLFCRGFDPYT